MLDPKIIEIIVWPVILLVLVIFFLLVFKKEIAEKIKTIKSVSKNGILMEKSQEIKNESFNNDDLLGKNDSITVQEQKDLIKKDLKKRHLDDTSNETIEVLIHQLAVTQLKLEFERIYNIIFGSQIYLLRKLNENAKQKNDIDSYVQTTLNNFEELEDWTVEEYLHFLFVNTLIIYDTQKELFNITNIGHEFLLWLLQNEKNENKRL